MKKCSKCEIEKPRTDFNKNRARSDGFRGECRDCQKIYYQSHKEEMALYRKAYYQSHKEEMTAQQKIYNQTDRGKEAFCRASAKTIQKFPEKHKARQAVNNAIRDGRLIRPSICESCFQEKFVQGHHEDHVNKPLEVDWLCIKCHKELHKKLLLV